MRPEVCCGSLGGVARGQCLSTGIRQRRHHPPVGGLVQLEKSPAFKQSSRPDLVGTQEYVRLLACCLKDAPHGGCECHWSLMCFSPSSPFRVLRAGRTSTHLPHTARRPNDGTSVSAGWLDTSINAVCRHASLRQEAIKFCTPSARMLPASAPLPYRLWP
jgi:hypothetical protein